MWNTAFSGTNHPEQSPLDSELLTTLRKRLVDCFPVTWKIEILSPPQSERDAMLLLTAPDGAVARIGVEVKRRVEPKDVAWLSYQHRRTQSSALLLVVAPFLSRQTQERLREAGLNYADGTGNLRLTLDDPAVAVVLSGAADNPWREQRVLNSLKGPSAGRVVRALCDFLPPFGIRELADRSQTAVSTVSRVVSLLDREALVAKVGRGTVSEVDWAGLIRRWTQDYTFTTSNIVRNFLEPRGLDALLVKLAETALTHAVTGSLAAARVAPIAPSRLAILYVDDIEATAASLNLRPAERGANVLLAQPYDAVVYDRVERAAGVTYAAPTQVAADLLTGPGRSPAEGEELLRWMEGHEDVWRNR